MKDLTDCPLCWEEILTKSKEVKVIKEVLVYNENMEKCNLVDSDEANTKLNSVQAKLNHSEKEASASKSSVDEFERNNKDLNKKNKTLNENIE